MGGTVGMGAQCRRPFFAGFTKSAQLNAGGQAALDSRGTGSRARARRLLRSSGGWHGTIGRQTAPGRQEAQFDETSAQRNGVLLKHAPKRPVHQPGERRLTARIRHAPAQQDPGDFLPDGGLGAGDHLTDVWHKPVGTRRYS